MITAIILEALAAEIKNLEPASSLSTCFDVFAGTSTGSSISCGLVKGLNAAEIQQFYEKKGAQISTETNSASWEEEVLNRARKGH